MILTGGGARHREIQKILKNALPKSPFHVADQSYTIHWHKPSNLDLSALPKEPLKEDLSLLSVSHGLSFERQTWPENNKPGDIEVLDIHFAPESPMLFAHLEQ